MRLVRTTKISVGMLCCLWQVLGVAAMSGHEHMPPANPDLTESQTTKPLPRAIPQTDPPLLTYHEITQLYQQDVPPPRLARKLNRLLTTLFVRNQIASAGVRMRPRLHTSGTAGSANARRWRVLGECG
jgi:hypothetical protein